MRKKIGITLAAVGFLMLAAAVNTYSVGDMNTIQFILQMIASVEALIASYVLGGTLDGKSSRKSDGRD